jgi:hypothetical protein
MTTVVGLITDNSETAYREVKRPYRVVQEQPPLPQIDQDKGYDCGLQEKEDRAHPILIDGAVVEQVDSFKYLGVHITNKLTWPTHTKTVVKREQNLFPFRRLKRFGMGPQILKTIYSCTI